MAILIVDDSELSRRYLADMLEEAGHENLLCASSSEMAFAVIGRGLAEAKAPKVDLILLDINLPHKSGIETCRELKADPELADIPVIIISGVEHLEGLQAAFDAGAMDYLTKPPNHVELLARIRSALHLKSEMDQRKEREAELLALNQRLESLNHELEKASTTDSLTGLANRRYFNEFVLREWRRAIRDKTVLAILMIDIDHFKSYNDSKGHLAGDVCLQRVAMALQRPIKRPADLLARYGGEEFVAVLPETGLEGAQQLADDMHKEIRGMALPHQASATADTITVSIGVAVMDPQSKMTVEQVLDKADQALYRAKLAGRNRTAG
ncbi:MAG: diguanylate cyclase response regulator [Desulfuromonas sp.]|nr:MAG: diguanylate cyclase response regulator [Desulfuromonas sp.]